MDLRLDGCLLICDHSSQRQAIQSTTVSLQYEQPGPVIPQKGIVRQVQAKAFQMKSGMSPALPPNDRASPASHALSIKAP